MTIQMSWQKENEEHDASPPWRDSRRSCVAARSGVSVALITLFCPIEQPSCCAINTTELDICI